MKKRQYIMKNLTTSIAIGFTSVSDPAGVDGGLWQITPLGDTYTNSADPTTNYGAQKTAQCRRRQGDHLHSVQSSSVPTGASLSQATLKLYVNAVSTAGAFEVYAVNGSWTESALTTASLQPSARDRFECTDHDGG